MKTVVMITGSTGSGKSTLAASMGKNTHVFSTGALVRHLMKDCQDENPVAPIRLNAIIIKKLQEIVAKYDNVVVECMPRNEEQLEWIDMLRASGIAVSVVRCVCQYDVRVSRIVSRDMTDSTRLGLDRAKIIREGDDWKTNSYFSNLLKGTQHTVIDTTFAHPDVSSPPNIIGEHEVDGMIHMAVNIHDKLTNSAIRTARMCDRAVEELIEAKESLDQHGNTIQVSEEIVDALFFIFVALHSLGINGDNLLSLYTRKYSVNDYRINSGTKPSATTGEA